VRRYHGRRPWRAAMLRGLMTVEEMAYQQRPAVASPDGPDTVIVIDQAQDFVDMATD